MNIDNMIKLGSGGNIKALEQLCEQMFQELLQKVTGPEQRRRLEHLHFRVKHIRYKYKNPIVACIKINELMMESLRDLNEALQQLKGEL